MISDAILLIFQGVLNIIFAPISVLNIAIDFVASIPVVVSFLQVVVYLLPWTNILPVIILVFAIFLFRIAISIYFFIKNSVFRWM